MVAEAADRRELDGVDRRPADEGAVDVLLGHDRRDVAGLHRTAVEHADAVRHVAAVELGELGADRRADLLRVLGRGDLTGADGPDRLVGDDDAAGLLDGDVLRGRPRPGRARARRGCRPGGSRGPRRSRRSA